MNYPVIVRAASAHQYVAQPLGIPEVQVEAATEAEAIAQVTEALCHWLATAKVIHVTAQAKSLVIRGCMPSGARPLIRTFPSSLKSSNACVLWIPPHDPCAPRHGSRESA